MLESALDYLHSNKEWAYPAIGAAGVFAGKAGLWATGSLFRVFICGVNWALTPAPVEPLAEEVAVLIEGIEKGKLDGCDWIKTPAGAAVNEHRVIARGAVTVADAYTRHEQRAIKAAYLKRLAVLKAEERERLRFAAATGEMV